MPPPRRIKTTTTRRQRFPPPRPLRTAQELVNYLEAQYQGLEALRWDVWRSGVMSPESMASVQLALNKLREPKQRVETDVPRAEPFVAKPPLAPPT